MMVLPLMAAVWNISKTIRLPKICVGNSFSLYLMHGIFLVLTMIMTIAIGIRDQVDGSIVIAFVRWAVAVCLSLLLAECLRRYYPRVASVLFGGR